MWDDQRWMEKRESVLRIEMTVLAETVTNIHNGAEKVHNNILELEHSNCVLGTWLLEAFAFAENQIRPVGDLCRLRLVHAWTGAQRDCQDK
jgi:hypothetical protein